METTNGTFKFKDGDVTSVEQLIKWIEAEQAKVKAKPGSHPPPLLVVMYQEFPRRSTMRRFQETGVRVLEKPPGFDGSDLDTRRRMIQNLLDQKQS